MPSSVVLSCPAVVTSVQTSGTCMDTGTCIPKKPGPCATFSLLVLPTQAGACEVDVSLADGSRYTAQVIFVEMPASLCCAATLVPKEQRVTINNPPSTCVDPWDAAAGVAVDAGTVSDAEAGSGEESDGDRGWDAVNDG
jgi:hypothetical protein